MIGLKDVSLKGGVSETNVDLFSFDFSETGLVLVVSASVSARKEFLNVFSGLKRPYGGSLLVDGRDFSTFSKREQDDYRYRTVQSIFDERSLLVDKNCFDNLFFGLHDNKETSKRLARDAMAESGLSSDKLTYLVKDLSPEDKKRFLLGKALLRDPQVLLMDDPLLLLNESEKGRFANTLKDVSKNRLVVVVTDDAHLFEGKEDQTLLLDGHIAPATAAEAVLSDHEVRKDAQERPRRGFSPFAGFKMAVRWLFSKPIYMAFFFVFCFLSSGFFSGYFSILEAQMPEKGARGVYESGRDYVSFRKREGGSDSEALLSDSDLDYVREKYGLDSSLIKMGDSGKYDLFKMTPFKQNDNFTTFMGSCLVRYPMGFLPYGETNENMPDYSLLCGTIPETENDVLITDYHWWVFRTFGYKGMTEDGSEITLEKDVLQSPEKLLGKRFMTPWDRSKDLKICGILKTSLDEKKYADYFEWLSRYGEEDFTSKYPKYINEVYFNVDFFLFLKGSYSDALYVRPSVYESLPSSGRTAIAPMPKKASDLLPFIRGEAKGSSRGSGYYYLFNSILLSLQFAGVLRLCLPALCVAE